MVARYNYRLRTAENNLEAIQENITSLNNLIESFKADEVAFTMQENGQIQTTQTTPDYYITLVREQVQNYRDVAEKYYDVKGAALDSLSKSMTYVHAAAPRQHDVERAKQWLK